MIVLSSLHSPMSSLDVIWEVHLDLKGSSRSFSITCVAPLCLSLPFVVKKPAFSSFALPLASFIHISCKHLELLSQQIPQWSLSSRVNYLGEKNIHLTLRIATPNTEGLWFVGIPPFLKQRHLPHHQASLCLCANYVFSSKSPGCLITSIMFQGKIMIYFFLFFFFHSL